MRLLLSSTIPVLVGSQEAAAGDPAPRCTIAALTEAESGLKKVVQRVNKAKRFRDLEAAIQQADQIADNPLLEGCFTALELMIATGPVNITDPQSTQCPVACPLMDESTPDETSAQGGRRARRRLDNHEGAVPAVCNVSSPEADPCCLDGDHPTKCCLPREITWEEPNYPTGVDAGMVFAMCEGVPAENLQKIGELVKALIQRLQDIDSGVAVQKCKARNPKAAAKSKGAKGKGAKAGDETAGGATPETAREVCYKILTEGLSKTSGATCKKNNDCFGVLNPASGKAKPGKCLGSKEKKCFYDVELHAEYMLPCLEAHMTDTETRWLKKSMLVPSNGNKKAFFNAFKEKVFKQTCVGPKSMRYPEEGCEEEMMLKLAEFELMALNTTKTEDELDQEAEAIFTMCDPKPIRSEAACLAQRTCNWGASLDDCEGLTAAERRAQGGCMPVTAKECAEGPRVEGMTVYKQAKFFCDYQGIDAGAWDSTRRSKKGCERGICTVAPEVQSAKECSAIKLCTVDCIVDGETFAECSTGWVVDEHCEEAVAVKEDALWDTGACALSDEQTSEVVEAWKACDEAACACENKAIPAGTFVTEDGTALADCAAVKEAGICETQPDATGYYCPVTCDSCPPADAADEGAARRQRRLQTTRRGARQLLGGRRTQEAGGEDAADEDVMLGACPASQFFGCPAADKVLSDHMGPKSDCTAALEDLEEERFKCLTAPVFKGEDVCTGHGYCWEDEDGSEEPAARRLLGGRRAQELGGGEAGVEAQSGMAGGDDDAADGPTPSTDKEGCQGAMQCEDKANFTEATCAECGMEYTSSKVWEGGEVIQGEYITKAADGAPVWRKREFAVANKFLDALDFEAFFEIFDAAVVAMDAEDVATEIECLMAPILNEMKQLVCMCDKTITDGEGCKAVVGAPAKVASKTVFVGTAVTVSAGVDSAVKLGENSLAGDAKIEISTLSAETQKSGEVSPEQNAAFTVVGASTRGSENITAGSGRRLQATSAPSACGYHVVYDGAAADPSAQLGSDGFAYDFGGASLAAAAPLCIARKATIPVDACKYSLEKAILAKMDGADGKIKKYAAATLSGSSYCANVQDSGTYYLAFEGPGTATTDCETCEASKIAEVGAAAATERDIKVETAAEAAAREAAAAEALAAETRAAAEEAVVEAATTTTTTAPVDGSTTTAGEENTTVVIPGEWVSSCVGLGLLAPLALAVAGVQ
mmetsp:Transcript_14760/g.37266  ORF Transcript_14760/g.37266 Transcript_14760/m.37266 type:complete len:1220 (+) Transcript_14760:44-3703(+)